MIITFTCHSSRPYTLMVHLLIEMMTSWMIVCVT
jgi:hypothetical protein